MPGRDPRRRTAHEVGAAIGDELSAQAGRRPNLHLADFGAVCSRHPEYLLDDHVHLTDEGTQALADLMVDAVGNCGLTVRPGTVGAISGPRRMCQYLTTRQRTLTGR